jgi:hypothetical protein
MMKKLLVLGTLSIFASLTTACLSAEGPAGSTPTEEFALMEVDTPTTGPAPTETALPDTATPEPPVQFTELGSLGELGSVVDMHIAGDYAYLADSFGGLQVVDISDPAQPTRASAFESPGSTRGQGVFVNEPYLYLADGQGVRILDVTDPTNPQVVGFYDTLGFALDLQVAGDLAYVAAREGGFYIGNFGDPTDPQHVSRLFEAGTDHVLDVQVSGDYAYIAMEGQGLKVVDVSQPDAPLVIGELDTDGTAEAAAIDGNLLYLADGEAGVKVIDVSTPAAPQEIGRFDTPGYAQDVASDSDYLHVADGPSRLLLVLGLSDPTNPALITEHETAGFVWGVTLSGSSEFLALGEQGFQILGVVIR